jgi:hypothetical protein
MMGNRAPLCRLSGTASSGSERWYRGEKDIRISESSPEAICGHVS